MTKLRVMKEKKMTELQFLSDIKEHFGWPVDCLRYHLITQNARFIDGNNQEVLLSNELQKKIKISLNKIEQVNHYIRFFSLVPWIEGVFITGSVGSLNASASDDIDVWLISAHKRLWLTRACEFIYFRLLGKRRNADDRNGTEEVVDKLCFNMYTTIAQDSLPDKNISTAMQFIDAIPVYLRRNSLYKQIVERNSWVSSYFPSWFSNQKKVLEPLPSFVEQKRVIILDHLLDICEYLAGFLMLLKATHKIVLAPSLIYTTMFTTWGTPRILSSYEKTESQGSKEVK